MKKVRKMNELDKVNEFNIKLDSTKTKKGGKMKIKIEVK
jgi:hypothetical protein